jgi:hypothetical protein
MISLDDYNNAPVIPGNKKVYFLNNDLVRVHHLSRASGIMSVYNINKGQIESCLLGDFRSKRERAYSVAETALLVNRNKKYLPDLMKSGLIPEPTGSSIGKMRGWQIRCYYSESQVHEIRDILSKQNIGRPRKDGLINNNITPTSQELTRRMGDGILTYTRTANGEFIPVWSETL